MTADSADRAPPLRSGLPPLVPLLAVLFTVDGAAATWHSLSHVSLQAIACVLFLALVGTTLGYWIWGRLLRDYSAAQVVPFATTSWRA